MKHFCDEWIQEWCEQNGWTDWFLERKNYWAFPPQAVMPLPIPKEVLLQIKAEKGFSPEEKMWLLASLVVTVLGTIGSMVWNCPIPLVLAFAFTAVVVASLELDY
ncbi:MAG: hypothetical protein NZ901_00925 [Geminocystis sp.]|nr:hypothetical protein [Geminocystis sp.]HIK36522.1 hypothetical protein [Geminocystis sp. M7585_C2015_104]MCS7146732.1 hypothetical protein [Geminocystis sp.]MCX8077118.1 hypothetical protein [Geminocystis sp.]MDW8115558.1 hypothetical protein [Geminocystis sp.]